MDKDEAVGQVFNIGSNEEVSIMELARRVKELTGSTSEIVTVPYDEAYEEGFEDMPRRVPDISKINALVGFRPTMSLDGILQSVIEYHSGRQTAHGELDFVPEARDRSDRLVGNARRKVKGRGRSQTSPLVSSCRGAGAPRRGASRYCSQTVA